MVQKMQKLLETKKERKKVAPTCVTQVKIRHVVSSRSVVYPVQFFVRIVFSALYSLVKNTKNKLPTII